MPSDGKPIITSERGGNLFRGYIATWQDADLIVGVVNALPAIFTALSAVQPSAKTADTRSTGGVEREIPSSEPTFADKEWARRTYNTLASIHSKVNCQWEHEQYLSRQVALYRRAFAPATAPSALATTEQSIASQSGGALRDAVKCAMSPHGWLGEQCITDILAALSAAQPSGTAADTRSTEGVETTLASLRAATGLTLRQVEAATKGRVSNALLSQMETGKIKRPSAASLIEIAAVYGVPFEVVAKAAGMNAAYASDSPRVDRVGKTLPTLATPPSDIPDIAITHPDTYALANDGISSDIPAAEQSVEVGLSEGSWFYPEGDTSSDECRFSPDEVIDYALEGEWKSKVVCIERALQLPAVYAAVHVYSNEEKDARESDDDYDYTLFATVEEARAALTPPTDRQEQGE